jgi:hypothetical protein
MLEKIRRLEERVMVLEKLLENYEKMDKILRDSAESIYREIKPRLDYEIDGEERGD